MRHETKVAAIILAAFLAAGYMTLEISASMMGTTPQEELYVALHTSDISTEEAIEQAREDYENEKIEAALLDRATVIENCTVTWYTADTCGKKPGHPAYGITASGYPVVEHLTCAVDPNVIPLYSDVFVQYADGTIEQLWATDTGVKGNALDIYTPHYDYAIQCGRQKLTVWFLKPEDGNE